MAADNDSVIVTAKASRSGRMLCFGTKGPELSGEVFNFPINASNKKAKNKKLVVDQAFAFQMVKNISIQPNVHWFVDEYNLTLYQMHLVEDTSSDNEHYMIGNINHLTTSLMHNPFN